jgi:hypothetical protein
MLYAIRRRFGPAYEAHRVAVTRKRLSKLRLCLP